MVQDARARMTPSTAGALVERSFAPLGPARPDESMLDLVGLIEILRRKFALIAITTVIVVAIAAAYAFLATPALYGHVQDPDRRARKEHAGYGGCSVGTRYEAQR